MNRLLILLTFSLVFACSPKEETPPPPPSTKEDVPFFDVKQFFADEINDIKKTPYLVYMIKEANTQRDSVNIPNQQIEQYARPFLQPNINDPKIKPYYEESLFEDQSTGSITFSYSTKNTALELQKVDVLLKEDGKNVKRVFMRKFLNEGSTLEQLDWKPNTSFEINRLVTENGQEKKERILIVWNPKR